MEQLLSAVVRPTYCDRVVALLFPADTDENVAWTRETWADLHQFSDGGLYLNFPGMGEEGEQLVRAAYGEETYDRLVALKDRYDPTNLFRINQNIAPTNSPT